MLTRAAVVVALVWSLWLVPALCGGEVLCRDCPVPVRACHEQTRQLDDSCGPHVAPREETGPACGFLLAIPAVESVPGGDSADLGVTPWVASRRERGQHVIFDSDLPLLN